MSGFDISTLIDEANLQKEKHHSVYEKILIKVYKKIKIAIKRRTYTFIYEVPNYLFGHALYNTKECIVFLIKSLRHKGLYVKYKNPNLLIISWQNAMRNNSLRVVKPIDTRKSYKPSSYNTNSNAVFSETNKVKNHYNKLNKNLVQSFNISDSDMITNGSTETNQLLSKLSGLKELSKFY